MYRLLCVIFNENKSVPYQWWKPVSLKLKRPALFQSSQHVTWKFYSHVYLQTTHLHSHLLFGITSLHAHFQLFTISSYNSTATFSHYILLPSEATFSKYIRFQSYSHHILLQTTSSKHIWLQSYSYFQQPYSITILQPFPETTSCYNPTATFRNNIVTVLHPCSVMIPFYNPTATTLLQLHVE